MGERGDALVFFGATGDLARRMIFPGLYQLVKTGRLTVPVIAVAFSQWNLEQLHARIRDSLETFGGGVDDEDAYARLLALVRYVDGDFADAATFAAVARELGDAQRPVHYLAIPPRLFGSVVAALGAHGCARDGRVVVEKPFGNDLASARALNTTLRQVFPETSICRIDHFLGEESIIDAHFTRMANLPFDAVFDRRHVARIQITMAEDFGVEDRGAFYDAVGALLDVVQNHVFQIVALLTMDAPSPHIDDVMRGEQARLLSSIRPLAPADLVRGQYTGYGAIPGVAAGSDTETYVALRMFIDSSRWAGVPILIRAGKRLPVKATEAIVEFAEPAVNPFPHVALPPQPSSLRIRFSPDKTTSLSVRTLAPEQDPPADVRELVLTERAPDAEEPYERLLGAALEGQLGLFVREDAVEAAWKIVEPVLHDRPASIPYAPGTWGPSEAEAIAAPGGWRDPVPAA